MRLEFSVDDIRVIFSRSWFTGKSVLVIGGKSLLLAGVGDANTHFDFALTIKWEINVFGHNVVIEKVRPQFMAGLRRQTYRIFVDGQVVAEKPGY